MKRIRHWAVLWLILALFLCGCSGRRAETDANRAAGTDFDRTTVSFADHTRTFNDLGVIYELHTAGNSGIARFFDPDSGTAAPICTKVNCGHVGDYGIQPDRDCDAYFGSMYCPAIIGNHLYYATNANSFGTMEFCRADVNGTNRITLHKAEDVQIFWNGCYESGHLIFLYYNQCYEENGELSYKREAGLCLLDLETEELRQIRMPADYGAMIPEATIDQDFLYYCYEYLTEDITSISLEETGGIQERMKEIMRQEIWRYDLTSGESSCLRSAAGSEAKPVRKMGYGWLYSESYDGGRQLEDLAAGKTHTLEAETGKGKSCCLFDEGAILCGDGEILLWNMGTGEVETLCSYDRDLSLWLNCVTANRVYVRLFDEGGLHELGEAYLPREKFLKGELEWNWIPELCVNE